MVWIWVAIVGYLVVQLAVGAWAAGRIHGETDYLVAGRNLGVFFASVSLFATWFGAETVMGSAAAIADKGLAGGRADPFGYTLCLVAMAILLAYQLRARGYVTLGDFFRARYGPAVEALAVIILVPTSIIWAAAQLLAFGQILVVVSGINLDVALAAAMALVIAYCVLGGLLGDVITDVLQGAILMIGLVLLLVLVVAASGGWEAALGRIEPRQLSFVDPKEGALARIDVWMVPVIGSLVSQEAVARLLAARSPSVARRACWVASGLYIVVGMVPVVLALIGTHLDLGIGHRDEFLPLIAQKLMPTALFVIFVGALISAILSTVDSTLLAAASLISHNLLRPLYPRASDRWYLGAARLTVVAAGVTAYFIARTGGTIYDLVQTASSFGTAGIAVTVVAGLWIARGGAATAFATLAVGVAATVLGTYVFPLEAPFMTSLALSLVTFVVLAALERRPARAEA